MADQYQGPVVEFGTDPTRILGMNIDRVILAVINLILCYFQYTAKLL